MRSRSRGDNTSLPIIEEENPDEKEIRIKKEKKGRCETRREGKRGKRERE